MTKKPDGLVYLVTTTLGLLVLSLTPRPARAQVSPGLSSISGLVFDNSDAVVPDAQVVVSNDAIGVKLMLTTSSGGVFNAPALAPASGYAVTVDKSGFNEYEAKGLELTVGQDLNLVVHLGLTGVTEQVQVVATTPVVDTTKTDVSQVIGTQQIQDYPLNGRRADQFALLTPGVTNDGNFGLLTFRGIANGNSFLLDGADATEQFYVENNGRTRITSQISLDAVQEFQVVSADYSAEYGRAMGGVINTVTRSGTNNLHGDAFGFFRNQGLMARDPILLRTAAFPNPNQWRLQSGASIAGPIIKDKLFFFVSTEFMRYNWPLEDEYLNSNYINATSAPPSFVTTGTNACTTPATPAQCAAIQALIPPFFGPVPRAGSENEVLGKLDWHPNDRNALSASFNYMYFNSPNGLQQTVATSTSGAALNGNGNDYGRVRNGRATWTYFFNSSLVNTLRYSWNTDLEGDNLNGATLPQIGALNVCIGTNSSSCSGGIHLGQTNYLPRIQPNETRNEVLDDFSWIHGRHTFKFGGDIATTNDFSIFLQNLNGQYNYQSLTTFAEDFTGPTTGSHWQSFTQAFGDAALTTRINDYDFYAQDQWRVTYKLTANLGVRYEYTQLPKPPRCDPNYTTTCSPINSPTTNFAPRIGLAYSLDSKTVVRAGYGMFYARMAGATLQDLFTTGNGISAQTVQFTSPSLPGAPTYPNILSAPSGTPTGTGGALALQFTAPNFGTPYSQQANLSVERDLGHGLGLTVSYLWSNGIHLYSVVDLNMPTTTTPFTYAIYNEAPTTAGAMQVGSYTTNVTLGAATANGRPNPNFGGLYQDGNALTMNYNALVVQLHKRLSYGLTADFSYTLSHELDDGQGYGQNTDNLYLSNNFNWLDNGNFKADYGNGEEDQPQRAVLSFTWTPPMTHRGGAFLGYVANNWQLSSISTFDGARPYGSVNVSVSSSPSVVVPGMFSSSTLNGTGLSFRVPFWPVNSVFQPAIYREDLRITKSFPFKERYRVDVGVEAFNLFNNWAPTVPQTSSAYTAKVMTFTPAGSSTPITAPVIVPAEFQVTGVNPPASYGVFPGCGCSDTWPVDGTEARRFQVLGRFTF